MGNANIDKNYGFYVDVGCQHPIKNNKEVQQRNCCLHRFNLTFPFGVSQNLIELFGMLVVQTANSLKISLESYNMMSS